VTCTRRPITSSKDSNIRNVIYELVRVSPGVGLILELVVPTGGLTLQDGRLVPRGTTADVNPRVANMNEEVFGANTEKFIPEY